MNEPNYQRPNSNIVSILRGGFRTLKIVLKAGINKMYRQIQVAPEDREFHKILCRFPPNGPTQMYKLNIVIFVTTYVPFLAARCLQQLVVEKNIIFLQHQRLSRGDFYVDDLLTGANTIVEAAQLRS